MTPPPFLPPLYSSSREKIPAVKPWKAYESDAQENASVDWGESYAVKQISLLQTEAFPDELLIILQFKEIEADKHFQDVREMIYKNIYVFRSQQWTFMQGRQHHPYSHKT